MVKRILYLKNSQALAIEDFMKARKFALKDKEITEELRLLAEDDKAVYQNQKELYKGLFGSRPDPNPERKNWLVLIWSWLLSLFSRLSRKRDKRQTDV